VKAGRFRADLFYRLSVLELKLPALRERTGDVVPLARLLLSRFNEEAGRDAQRFDARAERLLVSYDWPGNVRELRNVMERVSILGPRGAVPAELLARFIGLPPPASPSEVSENAAASTRPEGRRETLEEREKAYILEVLAVTGGNKSAAAEILGVTRNTLYNKLRAWGISTAAGEE
jgi:two-component system response regulator HydG